jgi:FKBP-type peptidyl-prolyl cis-trans isomerase SlyD
MKVEDNMIVSFDYRLTDDEGQEIDNSHGREPLAYLHGSGAIIPGLEKAMAGKAAGDSFEIRILPEDAYGERNDDLQQDVPREQFAAVEDLEEGMEFQVDTDDGPMVITVIDIADDVVTVDGNHDLAGVNLNFEVSVRDVREATAEEIEHGHAHGPGGHHHD